MYDIYRGRFILQANDIVTDLLDVNVSADKSLENEVIKHFYHDSGGFAQSVLRAR